MERPGNLRESLEWQDDALCAETEPEAFNPEVGESIKNAKIICNLCKVTEMCLRYALETGQQSGVWGGLSEHERRKLKRRSNQLSRNR